MTFVPVSKLRSESTGALLYIQPKQDWKGFKRSLEYEESTTVSVVLTLVGKQGGVVKCRADVSDIMFDDELPHCGLEGGDRVYFVIHLKSRTYWAYYDFAYAALPAKEKANTVHQSWIVYQEGTELHDYLKQLEHFSNAA